jgi:hypothetical protein
MDEVEKFKYKEKILRERTKKIMKDLIIWLMIVISFKKE